MSARDLIQASLDELNASDGTREVWHAAQSRATALLGTPGVVSALVAALLDGTGADRHRHMELFEVLIRQAHEDVENRGRLGERFLMQAGSTIEAMIIGGVLGHDAANDLAHVYLRAGVRPPEGLVALFVPQVIPLADAGRYTGELDAEIDRLRRMLEGDLYTVHMALDERFRLLPAERRAAVVDHVARRNDDDCGRLALYWLLDASADVRLAAASALHGRTRRGIVDPAFAALMPLLASWIPPDDARRALDTVSRDVRQRGPFPPLQPPARHPSRLLGVLPEGRGTHGFVAVLGGGGDLALAVFTIDTGRGIQSAFVLEDKTARAFLAEREADTGTLRLSWETFEPVLASAIADGLAAGRPPPPGLIDVALACELGELRPRPMAARDWLTLVDPGGALSGLPAQDRERLVEHSRTWPDDHPLVRTWTEGTMLIEQARNDASDPQQGMEPAFWARLEERREGWALPMLLSAHLLKDAGREDWRPFAAAASALLEGRPLGTIPIMQHVFRTTLDAWQAEEDQLRAHGANRPD